LTHVTQLLLYHLSADMSN